MNRRSRSTLFLMEQLIVIAVFAVCAAACVKILTASHFMATDTRDTSFAIRVAENCAECYKAVSGDAGKDAQILGGSTTGADNTLVVYYDKSWKTCGEKDAAYKLTMANAAPQDAGKAATLTSCDLSVAKLTGEVLITFPVATIVTNN